MPIRISKRTGENDPWSQSKLMFTFNLPYVDNNGAGLAAELEQVKRELLEIAGGYTVAPNAEGAWLDNNTGLVHYDPMMVVTVTFPSDREDIEMALRNKVRPWCDLLRQESLYTLLSPVLDVSQASTAALNTYAAVTK